jgi:hypothetical protein
MSHMWFHGHGLGKGLWRNPHHERNLSEATIQRSQRAKTGTYRRVWMDLTRTGSRSHQRLLQSPIRASGEACWGKSYPLRAQEAEPDAAQAGVLIARMAGRRSPAGSCRPVIQSEYPLLTSTTGPLVRQPATLGADSFLTSTTNPLEHRPATHGADSFLTSTTNPPAQRSATHDRAAAGED